MIFPLGIAMEEADSYADFADEHGDVKTENIYINNA